MQIIHRLRIPAISCALAVLLCELIAHPYTTMGVCDDSSYIFSANILATTGHIVYNGWATAIIGWQLFLGAAFIKLFGFSLTTVRMSTLLMAIASAFLLQRILVRINVSERNATIGTLALVLSPLYLLLSVTFMSDIGGLFAVILCLYGCLRALQASTSRTTIAWLCFAVFTNAICGTSRQVAWLGTLVMVPSALWLLRQHKRVAIAGALATALGAVFIFGCIHWFNQQLYSVPEALHIDFHNSARAFWQFVHFYCDIPFLLLPVAALFLPSIRKSRPLVIAILLILFACLILASQPTYGAGQFLLQPEISDWVSKYGIYEFVALHGLPPVFLHLGVRILLTIASLGGLIGLIASLFQTSNPPPPPSPSYQLSWNQLGILLGPFAIANTIILIPRSTRAELFDRYLLALLIVALLCMVRFYQDRIHLRLPLPSILLVAIMAIYAVVVTHNTFALYRARTQLAANIRSTGTPDTSVDNGWEYNFGVELNQSGHINFPGMRLPKNASTPPPPQIDEHCFMWAANWTPHVHPVFAVSFDPNACYGPAPFAPVHYSRWFASQPGTLYVVRAIPAQQ